LILEEGRAKKVLDAGFWPPDAGSEKSGKGGYLSPRLNVPGTPGIQQGRQRCRATGHRSTQEAF
jgi:hypothetical protein